MSHPRLLAILLLSLAIAGCGGKEAPVAEPAATGHIVSGIVLDPAIQPVVDAQVTLGDTTVATDADGRFAFPPTRTSPVTLRVEAQGMQPFARILDLPESELRITLTPLPFAEPYVRVADFRGYIECSGFVAVGHSHGGGGPPEGENPTDCGTYASTNSVWDASLSPELDGLVVEVVWQPQTELAQFLLAITYQVHANGSLEYLSFAEGASPLKVVFPSFDVQQRFADGGTIRTVVEIGGDPNGEDVAAGLAIDQEFEGFVSQFYGQRPPVNYSITA